jgi:hypothetical protein
VLHLEKAERGVDPEELLEAILLRLEREGNSRKLLDCLSNRSSSLEASEPQESLAVFSNEFIDCRPVAVKGLGIVSMLFVED